jgi:hypothetical protein
MLGTNAKKPLSVALSELDKETAARFAFEYFSRVRRIPCAQCPLPPIHFDF